MTLATAYRNKIDALWLDFHSGGITNPITVIEQISYLMFARLLDITESRNEKRAGRLKKDFKRLFPEDKQHIRWSHFRNEGGDRMLTIVRDEFFPFMRTNLQQHPLGRYLKDANCLIPPGNLPSSSSGRTGKCFTVPADEIRTNKYDLSLTRYKVTQHEESTYEPPKTLLKRMNKLGQEVLKDIADLEGMLK
ncbi:MAG: hypothetical protein RLZZ245_730 [Verrucomicrobiota bacterium]